MEHNGKLDDGFELNLFDTITKGFTSVVKERQPIRRTFAVVGYAPTAGGTFCLPVNNMNPAKGRIWEVTDAGVFYSDGHTNSNGASTAGTGSSTPAASGATIASVVLSRGSYLINYNGGVSGTTTAADMNNMKLTGGGLNQQLLYWAAAGSGAVTSSQPPVMVTVGSATTISIQTINTPSGTAVYDANITAQLISSIVVADLYVGPAAGLDSPGDMASFITSATVPTQNPLIGKDKAYGFQDDYIYAWIYNAPGGGQFILAGTILDWRIEDRMEMSV